MFRIACAIFLILSVLIAGCGGGGGGSSSSNGGGDVRDVTVAISPLEVTLWTGGQHLFNASVANATNTAVTWTVVEEIDGGIITADGLYTAPSTDGITCHVKATSVQDPSKYAIATITIDGEGGQPGGNNGVEVRVSPKEVFVLANLDLQFAATVLGHSNTAVTWSLDEANSGSITQDGLYTAPGNACTVHVRATSQADPAKSDAALVFVLPGGLPPLPPGS